MNDPHRTVTFTMSVRAVTDAPELLETVADTFPNDDPNINLTDDASQAKEPAELVDPQIAKQVKDSVKDALDLEDQAIRQSLTEPRTPEQVQGRFQQLRIIFQQEGMKMFIRAVYDLIKDANS